MVVHFLFIAFLYSCGLHDICFTSLYLQITDICFTSLQFNGQKSNQGRVCFACSIPEHVIAECWYTQSGSGTIAKRDNIAKYAHENQFNVLESLCDI